MTDSPPPAPAIPGQRVAILQCISGSAQVTVGEGFTESSGLRWEVTGFGPERIYSPSTLGGTPVVRARCLGEFPNWYQQYQNEDGTLDFCGDSVASMILQAHDGKRRCANGSLLVPVNLVDPLRKDAP